MKTRLCPPLTHKAAAELYKVFVKDTLVLAANVPLASILVAYDFDSGYPDLSWLNNGVAPPFFIQEGNDLGAKLIHAFNHVFGGGADKVVVIGSDTPHLVPNIITQGLTLLDNHDVVSVRQAMEDTISSDLNSRCPNYLKIYHGRQGKFWAGL